MKLERLAELIGIILGDGSINIYPSEKYSDYYRLKISFHKEDVNYMDYVSELLFEITGEYPIRKLRKNENTADLFIFKKKVIEYFLSLGLVKSPKWDRGVIPSNFMNEKLGKFILRGYFDTDGSVVLANNNGSIYPRLEFKISPSPMQQQLIYLLSHYTSNFKVYNLPKGMVRVQLNGKKNLKWWLEIIGFSNERYLKRANSVFTHN